MVSRPICFSIVGAPEPFIIWWLWLSSGLAGPAWPERNVWIFNHLVIVREVVCSYTITKCTKWQDGVFVLGQMLLRNREALNNNSLRFRHRNASRSSSGGLWWVLRLKILFTLSWGSSANLLHSADCLPEFCGRRECHGHLLGDGSAVSRYPMGCGKNVFLTLTFKASFTLYLFKCPKSFYSIIIPGCVQTVHSSSGLRILYCTGYPGVRISERVPHLWRF